MRKLRDQWCANVEGIGAATPTVTSQLASWQAAMCHRCIAYVARNETNRLVPNPGEVSRWSTGHLATSPHTVDDPGNAFVKGEIMALVGNSEFEVVSMGPAGDEPPWDPLEGAPHPDLRGVASR